MRPSENIEKLIKKLCYTTSAETHDRVLGNVLQALDEKQKQKAGVIRPDLWRTIMNTKTRKFAIAATILIAAIICLHYIAGPVSVTGTVYAEIVEKLQKARTLLYTVTTTTPVEGMPNMEMEVAFKEPGYMRMTMPGGYVSVMDCIQGKGLSIIPPRKQFIEMDMANMPDDTAQRQFDTIENLRTLPERADEVLGEREMDGRTVQGFRVNEKGAINTVWIDPKTRELVVVKTEFVNAPGMGATMTDFRFNVVLDNSLFILTPPDGYTRVEVQVDVSETAENDLIEFLRLWSTWTKDGLFPPTLNPVELAKVGMEMEKKGEFGQGRTSEQERDQHTMQLTRGMMFMMKLPAESNWRYAGENVKYGDAQIPIFWYKPAGATTYRVIYGDLSVKDVAPEDLPK
jgi:outer membrane lipoprotein-sorting protein